MSNLLCIYRAYGGELDKENFKPFRPEYFDKFRCWDKFYEAFSECADIIVVWDGKPKDGFVNGLHDWIKNHKGVTFIYNEIPGNNSSLLTCFEIARGAKQDYIYFCEDDYLHLPTAAAVLLDAFRISPMVTLYDHRDRYLNSGDWSFGKEYVFAGIYCHIRSVESTCCTFGIEKEFFVKNYEDFIRYSPISESAPRDREMWRYMLTTKDFRLISPMPGVATHCVKGLESPYVDWSKV